jgi:hypothetical protein
MEVRTGAKDVVPQTYVSPPQRTRGRVRGRSMEQRQAHGGVRSRGASASQFAGACALSLGSASQAVEMTGLHTVCVRRGAPRGERRERARCVSVRSCASSTRR